MHKHLKSGVTAALVAGGLLGVGTQTAHADSILFPYLNTNAGVFSFVTIANDGVDEFSSVTGYHFTYGHKSNPIANRRGCNHLDFNVVTTPADMMTFEVAGKVTEPGGVLFEGGSTAPVTSSVSLNLTSNQTAFLAVEPLGTNGASELSGALQLTGWAEVIDTAANMTLAYSTSGFGVNDSSNPDFALSNVGTVYQYISWYPTAFVTTSWHVLPTGLLSSMTPAIGGGLRVAVSAHHYGVGGAFNRDEAFISGTRTSAVRCFGVVTRNDLMQPGTVTATDNGGWSFLYSDGFTTVTLPPTDPDDPGGFYGEQEVVTHRVQTATAATGLAPRTAINREADWAPTYNITLDAGP